MDQLYEYDREAIPLGTYYGSNLRRGLTVTLPEHSNVEILEIRSEGGKQ